jgi:hypothetical protein
MEVYPDLRADRTGDRQLFLPPDRRIRPYQANSLQRLIIEPKKFDGCRGI